MGNTTASLIQLHKKRLVDTLYNTYILLFIIAVCAVHRKQNDIL